MSGTEQKNSASPFLPWMSSKATKGLTALMPESDCNQTAMGLPPVTSVFLIANLGNMWVSRKNYLRCRCYPFVDKASVVCMFVCFINIIFLHTLPGSLERNFIICVSLDCQSVCSKEFNDPAITQLTIAKVKQRSQRPVMGDQKFITWRFLCFGRRVKPLVPAGFAVARTDQFPLGPRGGLWPFLLMCYP
jgi:hypothetical protein